VCRVFPGAINSIPSQVQMEIDVRDIDAERRDGVLREIERATEEICAKLHEAGIPSAPVRTIPQVALDPHLWQREMLVKMEDAIAGEMYLPGATIKLSKTPARVGPVPTIGQHTDETLSHLLGYDAPKLAALRRAGAIA